MVAIEQLDYHSGQLILSDNYALKDENGLHPAYVVSDRCIGQTVSGFPCKAVSTPSKRVYIAYDPKRIIDMNNNKLVAIITENESKPQKLCEMLKLPHLLHGKRPHPQSEFSKKIA
mgnify:CR=1 FL=1